MASFPWFRLYSEVLTDRKLTRTCRATGQPRATVIGVWTVLLAMASSSPDRGKLLVSEGNPIETWEIQEDTGLTDEILGPILAEFASLGMIHHDNGAMVITNWVKRNFDSDVSTRRVRAFRERASNVSETSAPRFGNVLDTDTDTDTESDTESDITASAVTAKPPSAPRQPSPPAVAVFYKNTNRNPHKTMYADIVQAVGDDPADLAFWGKVVHAWIASGFKPTNVAGMLDCFRKRQLPGDGRRQQQVSDPIADYHALAQQEGWIDGNQT